MKLNTAKHLIPVLSWGGSLGLISVIVMFFVLTSSENHGYIKYTLLGLSALICIVMILSADKLTKKSSKHDTRKNNR